MICRTPLKRHTGDGRRRAGRALELVDVVLVLFPDLVFMHPDDLVGRLASFLDPFSRLREGTEHYDHLSVWKKAKP